MGGNPVTHERERNHKTDKQVQKRKQATTQLLYAGRLDGLTATSRIEYDQL